MPRRILMIGALSLIGVNTALAQGFPGLEKLDRPLRLRAAAADSRGTSRVIVRTVGRNSADSLIHALNGTPLGPLPSGAEQVAEVPNVALGALAASPAVERISLDRPTAATMERTGTVIGSTWVRQNLGYTGAGIGVAIIDSGITSWHDDLHGGPPDTAGFAALDAGPTIAGFVDFVNGYPSPYDDFGHGTHVAGIIAGNGYDSAGARAGVAPGATLVALKVLDARGRGYISNVIAAIDFAIAHRAEFNIRVLNLSVAAGVYESYNTDPLTLAARRAVDAGIVVVTAAGNLGSNPQGLGQYGGVTAPGNAPWLITVGASSHTGTIDRTDDTVAAFSSRGPTYRDYLAKPDLVAPGVGLESLSDPGSSLYTAHPEWQLAGSVATWYKPYLALTGTSMAAPVVAGTIALMLQANPALTPNAVKAILQYTSQTYPGYGHLTQGAGTLNARGAVHLAELFAGKPETPTEEADEATWGRHIIWGNHRIGGGLIRPDANAWGTRVLWGNAFADDGAHIEWGTLCEADSCDRVAWRADLEPEDRAWGTNGEADSLSWGEGTDDNIVWGAECGGRDCEGVVWGGFCSAAGCDNLVWGTAEPGDTTVWGDNGVADSAVWSASGAPDNIVWGSLRSGDNLVWDRPGPTGAEPARTGSGARVRPCRKAVRNVR